MYYYQRQIYNAQVKRSPLSRRIHEALEVIRSVGSRKNRTFAIYGMGFITEKYVRFAELNTPNFIGFTDSKDYTVASGNYFTYPCFDRSKLLENAPNTVIVSAYSRASMESIASTLNKLGFNGEIITIHKDVDG